MLSITTTASGETMRVSNDAIEKGEAETFDASISTESDAKLKRPSTGADSSKGSNKPPRVQEFQPLKCRCERSFVGIAEFVLHAQTCSDLGIPMENAVDLSFPSQRLTKTDSTKVVPPPTPDVLDLTVRSSESATASLMTMNPTLTCPECKANTVSHMHLLRHFESAHSAYGNYTCSCGVEFGWLPAFLSHHFLCPMMSPKIAQNATFDSTYAKKHIPLQLKQAKPPVVGGQPQPDLSRPFKCCHCVKSFKSKALLDQHMHIHYPPKYTCRYCAKKYRWPPVFYHHQRTCKKRPSSTTANVTASTSSLARVSEATPSRGYAPRTPQTATYQFPVPPPPPPIALPPPPYLLTSSAQEPRHPLPPALVLSPPPPAPPPPAFVGPWERRDMSTLPNASALRFPALPLPLGVDPELLRFPPPPPLPLPPLPMLPFYAALQNQTSNLCPGGAALNEPSSPVTCVCGSVFEGLSPYLSHITACTLFSRALSIPPPSLDETNSTMFLANMISVLEKCKPEFFQQFLIRNSVQSEAQDSGGNSCDQCGKEFSSRLSLKQHVEGKHSTEGKYQCPGCAKRYRWGASYYYHKKSCPAVSRDEEDTSMEDEPCTSPPTGTKVEDSGMCALMLFQAAAKGLPEHQGLNSIQPPASPTHQQMMLLHEGVSDGLSGPDNEGHDIAEETRKKSNRRGARRNSVSEEPKLPAPATDSSLAFSSASVSAATP